MNKTKPATTDELPPHSVEAEQGVLGCVLLAPAECLPEAMGKLPYDSQFYDLRHQKIFAVLKLMHAEGVPVDLISLQQRLKDGNELEQVGGLAYLMALPNTVPSAANLPHYLEIVKEKWMLRTLLAASAKMTLKIRSLEGDPEELLAGIQDELQGLAEDISNRSEQKLKFYLPAVIDNIEDYHRGHAQVRGLATGIDNVDKMLCGIGQENGNMIVLAARPGIGKTSLALQIADHVATTCVWYEPKFENGARVRDENGNPQSIKHVTAPVGIFSLEMSGKSLVDRMVWQRARADKQRWRTGFATEADIQPLTLAAVALSKAEIYIDDTPRCTIEELAAKARRMKRQYGIRLFIVDYLQLVHSAKRDWKGDRVQELAYISGVFAALGKVLDVPFLILAQMNRDWEKEVQRPPRLSDLKDSGAIEQDADLVGFIYAPKQNRAQEDEFEEMLETIYGNDWSKHPRRLNLLWEKNRHGMTGDCWLLFHKSCTAFEDFNVWMKAHKFKGPAAGEPRQQTMIDPADVPGD